MSALAFPHVWIPNLSIRDRLNRLTEWFSDQKIQRGSDGKIRRGTDGKIKRHATGSEPCCCAAAGLCSGCSGAMQSTATVVISNWVPCSGCINYFTSRYVKYVSGSMNGTYTVDYQGPTPPDQCNYFNFSFTGGGPTFNFYSDSGCTTLLGSTSLFNWFISFAFVAGHIYLESDIEAPSSSGAAVQLLTTRTTNIATGGSCAFSGSGTQDLGCGVLDTVGTVAINICSSADIAISFP